MYNPKDVFTEDGYLEYRLKIKQLEDSLFYFINMADDLHLGVDDASDDALQALYNLQTILEETKVFQEGTGENREE